jgi:uncharacterized cupredoxin-like copper-binding protein
MKMKAAIVATAAALTVGVAVAGCGDDDDSSGEETASTEEVTLTTGDTSDGFSWDVEPTPAADTKTITYTNNSDQPHALVFARINEGFTLDEAYKLEGEKGSATTVAESSEKTSPGPGETVTIDVTEPIEPGSYAMICPIPGHYQQGQLAEFEVE